MKPPVAKSCTRGNGARMAQQALGGEDDQRLAHAAAVVAAVHLAAQQVEVLRRSGAVAHLHVVFGAERQEALDAGAGMLGALAFKAVRQQHHQAARLAPLGFGAGNELVDHDLRAVGEVAELRFPDDQRQRVGHAVAEFEAQHGVFAQRAVEDIETRLVRRNVLHGNVALAGFVIVERQMALAEGAAAGILAAEPDGRAFERQRAEGQRFGRSAQSMRRRPGRWRRGAFRRSRAAWDAGGKCPGKLRDAANHALKHLLVHRGARAESGDLAGRDRAQFLQLVMLGLRSAPHHTRPPRRWLTSRRMAATSSAVATPSRTRRSA